MRVSGVARRKVEVYCAKHRDKEATAGHNGQARSSPPSQLSRAAKHQLDNVPRRRRHSALRRVSLGINITLVAGVVCGGAVTRYRRERGQGWELDRRMAAMPLLCV